MTNKTQVKFNPKLKHENEANTKLTTSLPNGRLVKNLSPDLVHVKKHLAKNKVHMMRNMHRALATCADVDPSISTY